MSFRALILDRDDAGSISASMTELDDGQLPAGDLTIDVEYPSLNDKGVARRTER